MNVIGVDVGTSSVRLAIIRFEDGDNMSTAEILASHSEPITTTNFKTDYYEQSTSEIWRAICTCCRDCLNNGYIDPKSISAIGFSSTCSLVVVEDENNDEQAQNHKAGEINNSNNVIIYSNVNNDSNSRDLDCTADTCKSCSPNFDVNLNDECSSDSPVETLIQTSKDNVSESKSDLSDMESEKGSIKHVSKSPKEKIKVNFVEGGTINGNSQSNGIKMNLKEKRKPCLSPNCVTSNTNDKRDVILWMDHRAVLEAAEISATQWKMLQQFGGICSPEFSLAKFVWLSRNDPQRFNRAQGFLELTDWLVYKCLAPDVDVCDSPRSLCSVTCKWGYESNCDSSKSKWPLEELKSLKLLRENELEKLLGTKVLKSGRRSGYLSHSAAIDLGLVQDLVDSDITNGKSVTNDGTATSSDEITISDTNDDSILDSNNETFLKVSVGTSLIDAHAGMLAMISALHENEDIGDTFCSLAGTSTCHMLLSPEPLFTSGVWGPYCDVILDGFYLREAGQSWTGALIEFAVKTHPDGRAKLREYGSMATVIKWLDKRVKNFEGRRNDLHIVPSFHGNRSPIGNPRLRGGIYGLRGGQTPSLDELYVAVIESLAYETRSIIEKLDVHVARVLLSGGLLKNVTFMEILATVLKCPVICVRMSSIDLMVVGAALVARNSARDSPLLPENLANIEYKDLTVQTYAPCQDKDELDYHERKYQCFHEYVKFSLRVDEIMNPEKPKK